MGMEAYKPLIKVRALHAVLPAEDSRLVVMSCSSTWVFLQLQCK